MDWTSNTKGRMNNRCILEVLWKNKESLCKATLVSVILMHWDIAFMSLCVEKLKIYSVSMMNVSVMCSIRSLSDWIVDPARVWRAFTQMFSNINCINRTITCWAALGVSIQVSKRTFKACYTITGQGRFRTERWTCLDVSTMFYLIWSKLYFRFKFIGKNNHRLRKQFSFPPFNLYSNLYFKLSNTISIL